MAKKGDRGVLMNHMGRRILSFGAVAFASLAVLAPSHAEARQVVHLKGYSAGTIVVMTRQRRLYYMMTDDTAML